MDQQHSENAPVGHADAATGHWLAAERERALELLAAERALLEMLPEAWSASLEQAGRENAQSAAGRWSAEELEARAAQLSRDADELAVLTEELGEREQSFEQAQSAAMLEHQAAAESLRQREEELRTRGDALAEREKVLAQREQWAAERAAQAALQEVALPAELPRDLQDRLAAAETDARGAREQATQLRRLLNARGEELSESRGREARLQSELAALAEKHERLLRKVVEQESHQPASDGEPWDGQAQRETDGTDSGVSNGEAEAWQSKLDEMQRRFELAVEDVRELKLRNNELESQLAKAATHRGSGNAVAQTFAADNGDWETQKRRLLAALEADDDGDPSAEEKQTRLSIESTIRITDSVVAEKDREIAELRHLLDQQSSNFGGMAVGATAIAGKLDEDELIRMERERLIALQEDWQAKMRAAEIEISVERAKIARDRAEVEQKLATLVTEQHDNQPAATDGSSPPKASRGRWLARLGLKDADFPKNP